MGALLVAGRGLSEGSQAHSAWHYSRDGHIIANLDVLDGFDENHQLIALRSAESIWLDIGINMDSTPLPGRNFLTHGPSAFYLGFEPLLDKYAAAVGKGVRAVVRKPLGRMALQSYGHAQRFNASVREAIILPMAVADNGNRPATFHISNIDGCATLSKQVDTAKLIEAGWDKKSSLDGIAVACGKTMEKRTVPSITLATILGQWLGGKPVAFMHVDVQGNELSVIKSARHHIERVERIMLEVPTGRCATLTENAPGCEEIFSTMAAKGFEAEDAFCNNDVRRPPANLPRGFGCAQIPRASRLPKDPWVDACKCEADILFVRKDARNTYRDADAGIGKRRR